MESKSHFLIHFIPGILTGAVIGLAFGSLFILTSLHKEEKQTLPDTDKEVVDVVTEETPAGEEEMSPGTRYGAAIKAVGCDNATANCLYLIGDAYYPAGLATVKGYYEKYSTTGWDDKPVTCEGFVMTDGPELLTEGFEKLIAAGSGVITKVEDGLRIAINQNDVTPNEYNDIRRSTKQSQIILQGFVTQPLDGGVETCYEPMRILNIE
jgi:hypothetical protein